MGEAEVFLNLFKEEGEELLQKIKAEEEDPFKNFNFAQLKMTPIAFIKMREVGEEGALFPVEEA